MSTVDTGLALNSHQASHSHSKPFSSLQEKELLAGTILCMRPPNERWYYIVRPSLIGWVYTQNGPCLVLEPEMTLICIVVENSGFCHGKCAWSWMASLCSEAMYTMSHRIYSIFCYPFVSWYVFGWFVFWQTWGCFNCRKWLPQFQWSNPERYG